MKKIPLTRGREAIVDDDMYTYLNQWKWYATPMRGGTHEYSFYAARNSKKVNGKRSAIRMHRLIVNARPGQFVDHINGDGLDNRISNLRICTQQQNNFNARPRRDNKYSKYKGVRFVKAISKWLAAIKVDGVEIRLGYFAEEVEAHNAYKEASKEYHGVFGRI